MITFESLYEFTADGMNAFQRAMEGSLDEAALDATDPRFSVRVSGTRQFSIASWPDSKEMAQAIIGACGDVPLSNLLQRNGVWAWLAFAMRDEIYPRQSSGARKLGEVHRWYPADLNDFRKGQRHLVRMPVILLASFGENADHLLCGPPATPGELREQLTSQQSMFHPTIQAVARMLYFEDSTGRLRKGSGGKGGGSARRLAQVLNQLDVTWDLFAISPQQFLAKLPKEFDRWKEAPLKDSVSPNQNGSATGASPTAID